MELLADFDQFLAAIRPTEAQSDEMRAAHQELRNRLHADKALEPILIDTFLQGSYRRATLVKPDAGNRADVDVVVATCLSEKLHSPQQAQSSFALFLDRHYKGKWQFQGRSIGIEVGNVDLDLVPTSAPSEVAQRALRSESVSSDRNLEDADWIPSESWHDRSSTTVEESLLFEHAAQWQVEPLRIPDRDASQWDDTHPLEQIRWTWEKNRNTNGLYVNVVKVLKWWRRHNPLPKYPKGYPLEHLIGISCPDGIDTVATGVVLTLEDLAVRYLAEVESGRVPFIPDHGVPSHNVLHRISLDDFMVFLTMVRTAALAARSALQCPTRNESRRRWHELFGDPFPRGDDDDKGYTPRASPTNIPPTRERWA